MTPRHDPELDELLGGDPELLDLARTARSRRLDAPVGQNFQRYLRARLMDEAQRSLQPRGLARLRRALAPRPSLAAGAGATAGIAMIVVAGVLFVTKQAGSSGVNVPTARSDIGGQSRVDPQTKAITIAFSEPMDHASVVRALHIVPATSVTTSWTGNNL
ncbi:MAG TPA: hypothetical protein VFO60_07975, partial [Candidatus Dormibacteraeota bacterium]|nr:hypothetical protein [Candidatus Dormibacteraeota bacterium]